ncbi:uncharacterized protein [Branchiostoma lanceolatum]|uniref:uncharacterized protein isoform X2 n=1 Tax=Branchiostoma lanceolatum TaxID=7740 RepID=UPI003451E1CF
MALCTFVVFCMEILCLLVDSLNSAPSESQMNLPSFCDKECPPFETLCSTGDYEVRRYASAMWVSTTEHSDSFSYGQLRAAERLVMYIQGENSKGIKMPLTVPFVTQLSMTGDAVTVAALVSRNLHADPPTPQHPKVVIDVLPETVLYVRPFLGYTTRRLVKAQARKLFRSLQKNAEPFDGEQDYFYVARYPKMETFKTPKPRNWRHCLLYGDAHECDSYRAQKRRTSSSRRRVQRYNEIWVFATNERTQNYRQFVYGREFSFLNVPSCLRDSANDPLKTWGPPLNESAKWMLKTQCGDKFCTSKSCPKYKVLETYKTGIETRSYGNLHLIGHMPATCHYDYVEPIGTEPIKRHMNKTDELSRLSTDMLPRKATFITQRYRRGHEGCDKFFLFYYPVADVSELNLKRALLLKRFDYLDTYVRCFTGYVSPDVIMDQARHLSDQLQDNGLCRLRDRVTVSEYDSQSRLFDRHNEILFDAADCNKTQERAPEFVFTLPVSDEKYKLPDIGDRCSKRECASFKTLKKYENFRKKMSAGNNKWVCVEQKSCDLESTRHSSLNRLLSYINGMNSAGADMDLVMPLAMTVNMTEGKAEECAMTISTCLPVPHKHHQDVPWPLDTEVVITKFGDQPGFYQSFPGAVTTDRAMDVYAQFRNLLHDMRTVRVHASLKEVFSILIYDPDEAEKERYNEIIIMEDETETPRTNKRSKQEHAVKDEAPRDPTRKREIVYVPMPPRCKTTECMPIRKTKDFGDFWEITVTDYKGVCHYEVGCGAHHSGRKVFRPLLKYFAGDNVGGISLGSLTAPLFFNYQGVVLMESGEEGSCSLPYEVCLPLPKAFRHTDAIATRNNHTNLYTRDEVKAYITRVHEYPLLARTIREHGMHLMERLDEEGVKYDKEAMLAFTYDDNFTPPSQRVSYVGFGNPISGNNQT